jgi:murein DD-endopeptidase MepM/ murein hydrolase activator NlpD
MNRPPVRGARGVLRTAMAGMMLGAALFVTAASIHLIARRPGAPSPVEDMPPPRDAVAPPPADLMGRDLVFPVRGIDPKTVADTFTAPRGASRLHNAVDIMAARGTPVVAAAAGTIQQLGTGGAGGIAVYEIDESGKYAYYYAHLDRLAPGLAEGQAVAKGDVIGYVGSTGNAPEGAPHLHFAIYEVGDAPSRWGGRPINPFPLWRKAD